jgi:hypothetical protein
MRSAVELISRLNVAFDRNGTCDELIDYMCLISSTTDIDLCNSINYVLTKYDDNYVKYDPDITQWMSNVHEEFSKFITKLKQRIKFARSIGSLS